MKKKIDLDLDFEKIEKEFNNLKKEIEPSNSEDIEQFNKLKLFERSISFLGYITAWIIPFNIFSAFLISFSKFIRWMSISHSILHNSYNSKDIDSKEYKDKSYAKYGKRYLDWIDWIEPSLWEYEHNKKHHYHLGEKYDPESSIKNILWIKNVNLPIFIKYIIVIMFSFIWKFTYFIPNMIKLKMNKEDDLLLSKETFSPFTKRGWELWYGSYLPYFMFTFVLKPLPFLLISNQAYIYGLITFIIAEMMTSFHSFLVMIPNHTGKDIYSFNTPHKSQGEFYYRQIIGTVNYNNNNKYSDIIMGWFNYQIEHQLFPNLPLNQYKRIKPRVKEFCEKNNLPYREENLFKRFKMSLDIIIGEEKIIVWEEYIKENNIKINSISEDRYIHTETFILNIDDEYIKHSEYRKKTKIEREKRLLQLKEDELREKKRKLEEIEIENFQKIKNRKKKVVEEFIPQNKINKTVSEIEEKRIKEKKEADMIKRMENS